MNNIPQNSCQPVAFPARDQCLMPVSPMADPKYALCSKSCICLREGDSEKPAQFCSSMIALTFKSLSLHLLITPDTNFIDGEKAVT